MIANDPAGTPAPRPTIRSGPGAVHETRHPIRAISLDLDDTLWPVLPTLMDAERALGSWLERHAPRTAVLLASAARAVIRQAVVAEHPGRAHDLSFVREESLRRGLAQAGEDEALAQPAFEVFLDARQRVAVYGDVHPVLARWAGRYRIVSLSNGNADLERIGLRGYFHATLNAREAGCAKPDPRIFARACEKLGVQAAEVLHIGDHLHDDVHAACAAGMQAAWLRRPDLVAASSRPRAGSPAGEAPPPPFSSLEEIDAALLSRRLAPDGSDPPERDGAAP